jgi:tetratricopeptide (TPR) repeat protein
VTWVYLQPLTPYSPLASPEQVGEIETHVRKVQACLQREHSRDDPTLLFALGKSLLHLGRTRSALEALHGALDRAPANTSVHLELGKALLAFRRPEAALAVLERGARIAQDREEEHALDDLLKLIEAIPGAGTAWRSALESRGARRVPLDVTITRSDGIAPGVYVAVNISESGICVNASRAEPVERFVALDFVLEGQELHVYAKTIWCREDVEAPEGRRYTIGLRFISPARSLVEQIRRYVEQQVQAARLPSLFQCE